MVSSLTIAQTETATLSGTVMDKSGAVIPTVQVQVTNSDTNISVTTTTNNSGVYVVPSLKPGRYRLAVTKQGFKQVVLTDVVLNVQDVVSRNFTLEVGATSETITVTAEAERLNTTTASVGTVVDRQFIENLPLNGRSFQTLINLTPGVVVTPTYSSEVGQFSVNGQRANANYFMIDGVSANIGASFAFLEPGQSAAGTLPGFNTFGGTNNLVSIDALEEFRIQTSTYAAEFGRQPGAQISAVTRSGTNEFHGTLFDYFRNDVLDANDWFANSRGLKKPALRQNDFGGVFSGPIDKNRTFFLVSYESLRLRLPQTVISDVPSLALRQSAPAGFQPYLNAFPLPNGPPTSPGLEEFAGTSSDPSSLDAVSLRLDHHIGDKFRLFGRYSYASSDTLQRGRSFLALSAVEIAEATTQTITVGATLIATPTITNDLRVNYSRNRGASRSELDDFGGAVVPPDSVFFPPFVSSKNGVVDFFLGFFDHSGLEAGKLVTPLQRQINLVNNLSVVTGTHQLKFGVDYRYLFPLTDVFNYNLQWGVFDPLSALTGMADFVTVDAFQGPQGLIYHNLSLYAQDTWRATPRLTLTYGLRWEVNPPPTEQSGKAAAVAVGVDNPTTMTLAPPGTRLWKTTFNNFAPRVGLAYLLAQRAGWETVFRGGFGIFYDLGTGPAGNAFTAAYPFSASKFDFTPQPVPLPLAVAEPAPFGGPPTASSFFFLFDSDLKLPYTYQWNIALEQGLSANQSFSASYVGAVGRRLFRNEFWSNPSPDVPGGVRIVRNEATSDYHALQLQFQRRLSRGLQALASYTWSHAIDMASREAPFFNAAPATEFDPRLDRGDSNFDVRHAFSGSLTYDIPTLHAGRVGSAMLRDWSVDTIVLARSGLPVDVVYFLTGSTSFGLVFLRPDVVPGVPFWVNETSAPGGRRINPAAFSIPTTERQGTLPRNALRGFGAWQADLALRRQFRLSERISLQFRAEFFNIFNHPNFGDPGGAQDLFGNNLGFASGGVLFFQFPGFGQSASTLARSLGGGRTGFSPLYQIGGPRSIQLALKLQF
jgi:hypothetical protein